MANDFDDSVQTLLDIFGGADPQMNWLSVDQGSVYVRGQGLVADYGIGRSGDNYVFVITDADEPTGLQVDAVELRDAIRSAEEAFAAQGHFSRKKTLGCTIDSTLGPLGVFVKKNTLILEFPTSMEVSRHFMGEYAGKVSVASNYRLDLSRFKPLLGWCDRHPQPTSDERQAGAYAFTS